MLIAFVLQYVALVGTVYMTVGTYSPGEWNRQAGSSFIRICFVGEFSYLYFVILSNFAILSVPRVV